ncbi:hypothetical protein G6F46_015274 [Rhizopus delemar]|nr:hypothetical protein G6F46_015274 [Rhizopus delemar]
MNPIARSADKAGALGTLVSAMGCAMLVHFQAVAIVCCIGACGQRARVATPPAMAPESAGYGRSRHRYRGRGLAAWHRLDAAPGLYGDRRDGRRFGLGFGFSGQPPLRS